jgi:hypothetical protein
MGFLLLSSEEAPNNSKISPLPERGLGFFFLGKIPQNKHRNKKRVVFTRERENIENMFSFGRTF